jgi:hypothetical protein
MPDGPVSSLTTQQLGRGVSMSVKRRLMIGAAMASLFVLGGLAIAAQDAGPAKYTVQVPGGLAFSEFKGYESWQAISTSGNGKVVAVILGNPVMIAAYAAGIPANGKPVPEDGQGPLAAETESVLS